MNGKKPAAAGQLVGFGFTGSRRLPKAGGDIGINTVAWRQVILHQGLFAEIHPGYRLRDGAILAVGGGEGNPIFIDWRKRYIQSMDN